jgi:hypothetical protein
VTADDLRTLALALPGAEEKSHFGKTDFRVGNKIFASLPGPSSMVVKFTPDQQEMLTDAEPAIFRPVTGGWGRKGWTLMDLASADEAAVRSALRTAWGNVASKNYLYHSR